MNYIKLLVKWITYYIYYMVSAGCCQVCMRSCWPCESNLLISECKDTAFFCNNVEISVKIK